MADRPPDHSEIELKFELDDSAARQIRRHALLSAVDHQTQSQMSAYFDTDKREFHHAGYSLRIRKIGDRFTQTVKTNENSSGLFDRGEWEAGVEQMAPDAKALGQTPLRKFKKLCREAKAVVCSDVKRRTWLLDRGGSIVEVVLDIGTVSGGDQEAPLHELELELKCGEPAAIFSVAHELAQAVPLHVGVLSKEERGRMLAESAFEQAQKAGSIDVRRKMDVGQVLASIIHECVRHFRLNEELIIGDRDPDALHQARVALRRLRTAISLFRPAFRQASLKPLRKELRKFLVPFGEARNLDVFLDHHGNELGRSDRRKVISARDEAYDRVIDLLEAPRSRDMFLDIIEWTTSGDWRKPTALMPIGKFAGGRLHAAWGKVKRRGNGISDLEERQLHRLRIGIKKLRYAVGFLGPLYAKKRVRKFASSLEKMQDCLGLIHDDIVSRQIASDFDLDEAARTDITARLRQTTAARFAHLKRVRPPWIN